MVNWRQGPSDSRSQAKCEHVFFSIVCVCLGHSSHHFAFSYRLWTVLGVNNLKNMLYIYIYIYIFAGYHNMFFVDQAVLNMIVIVFLKGRRI
jgi:hypothetical protein